MRNFGYFVLGIVAIGSGGCFPLGDPPPSTETSPTGTPVAGTPTPEPAPVVDAPRHHVDCAPSLDGELASFRNPLSYLVVELGSAVHAARDVVVKPGEAVPLHGKFAYGPTSKDLEGEDVLAFVAIDGACDWVLVGEARTNSDGRATIDVDPALFESEGRYPFWLAVRGDGTGTFGFVEVMAPGTGVVVFDIDGTLTTDDLEQVDGIVLHTVGSTSETLFDLAGSPLTKEQWLFALDQVLDENAAMHEGAVDVVNAYVDAGFEPVYVTGRPYLYDAMTRAWLEVRGFPAGPLRLTDDVLDSMPSNVAAYKLRELVDLRDRVGLELGAAYGNATTDICAYAEAGIDVQRTFIIGPHAGEACAGFGATVPVTTYPEHLAGGLPVF